MKRENTIDYIEIPASDLDQTKAFFSALLGWQFTDWSPKYCSFRDGRMEGGFYKSERIVSSGRGSPLVVFYRMDLEAAAEAVVNFGGSIVKPIFSFPGGRRFHFTDPNGNEFAIWTEVKAD